MMSYLNSSFVLGGNVNSLTRGTSMQWYYVKNGEKEGPLSNADIPLFIRRGDINDDTLVWHKDLTDWMPYGKLPKTADAELTVAKSSTGPTCSLCEKEFGADQLIQFEGVSVCADCKPNFIQQLKENAEITSASIIRYAGFWRRFGAVFIDGIIMYVANLPIGLLFGLLMPAMSSAQKDITSPLFWPSVGIMYVLQLFIPACYVIIMLGKYGATLGKKAVGIKVVMSDGSPITYGRSTGRYFATILSGLIMNIGYIMAAFDEEKRALHDHMCNTRVIYK